MYLAHQPETLINLLRITSLVMFMSGLFSDGLSKKDMSPLEFVTFKEYKASGGKMQSYQFDAVTRRDGKLNYPDRFHDEAILQLASLNARGLDNRHKRLYVKIAAMTLTLSPYERLAELYLIQKQK